mmetsp:Transcript_42557/g.133361  ORF Transcript_42557/g.133361 Transcript_42557/m.133361 type:complete len:249 (-) Transcript_42557:117-863(-)
MDSTNGATLSTSAGTPSVWKSAPSKARADASAWGCGSASPSPLFSSPPAGGARMRVSALPTVLAATLRKASAWPPSKAEVRRAQGGSALSRKLAQAPLPLCSTCATSPSMARRSVGCSMVTSFTSVSRPGRSMSASPPAPRGYTTVCVCPFFAEPKGTQRAAAGAHGARSRWWKSTVLTVGTATSTSAPLAASRRRRSGPSDDPGSSTSTLRPRRASVTAVCSAPAPLPTTTWSHASFCSAAARSAVR